ncbi:MAG: hypothetical protein VX032_05165 [SAR324 cluster bacterium]|nr:hypothetical protein [SAR324 cluster bacterium]
MSCCYRTAAPSPSQSTPASTPTLAAPTLARKDGGFHLHPTLAGDAEQEDLYGLAHLHFWTRSTRQPSQREDPIEQKESYRWLASPLQARQRIPASVKTTMVADRESDIL